MNNSASCTIKVESKILGTFPESRTFEAQVEKITNELKGILDREKEKCITEVTVSTDSVFRQNENNNEFIFCLLLRNITSKEDIIQLLTEKNCETFKLLEVYGFYVLTMSYTPKGFELE